MRAPFFVAGVPYAPPAMRAARCSARTTGAVGPFVAAFAHRSIMARRSSRWSSREWAARVFFRSAWASCISERWSGNPTAMLHSLKLDQKPCTVTARPSWSRQRAGATAFKPSKQMPRKSIPIAIFESGAAPPSHPQLSKNDLSFRLRLGCFSLRSALASICRMRSRVTLNCWPTSSSV